jgi:hypothetical protein
MVSSGKETPVRKLSEDFRIAILGATAGLFSSSVTLLIARIDTYYEWLNDTEYSQRIEDLWWIPFSLWHVLLSIVASFLVHGYLKTRLRSPFLLWQTIGITSLIGWGLTFIIAISVGAIMRGDLMTLERLVLSTNVELVAKHVSTVFACNVLYGSVMNASSRQYVSSN